MQNINSTTDVKSEPERRLCKECEQFYGGAATNFLCSSCWKLQQKVVQQQQVQTQQPEKIVEEKAPEVVVDASRCKACNRKLGIYGYQCKCNFFFCSKHRVPEEHACNFDHGEKAKQQLIKNNTLVEASKIEKS